MAHAGSMTLLGDAARAMTPNLGQGACQALEDGVTLAALVADARPGLQLATALAQYDRLRRPRAAALVRRSRQVGTLMQGHGPVAAAVRDTLLRATPQHLAIRAAIRAADWHPPTLSVHGAGRRSTHHGACLRVADDLRPVATVVDRTRLGSVGEQSVGEHRGPTAQQAGMIERFPAGSRQHRYRVTPGGSTQALRILSAEYGWALAALEFGLSVVGPGRPEQRARLPDTRDFSPSASSTRTSSSGAGRTTARGGAQWTGEGSTPPA
jgi:hypothetical protein